MYYQTPPVFAPSWRVSSKTQRQTARSCIEFTSRPLGRWIQGLRVLALESEGHELLEFVLLHFKFECMEERVVCAHIKA
jgi:hypothetical protein